MIPQNPSTRQAKRAREAFRLYPQDGGRWMLGIGCSMLDVSTLHFSVSSVSLCSILFSLDLIGFGWTRLDFLGFKLCPLCGLCSVVKAHPFRVPFHPSALPVRLAPGSVSICDCPRWLTAPWFNSPSAFLPVLSVSALIPASPIFHFPWTWLDLVGPPWISLDQRPPVTRHTQAF